jgi:hypothetical protein
MCVCCALTMVPVPADPRPAQQAEINTAGRRPISWFDQLLSLGRLGAGFVGQEDKEVGPHGLAGHGGTRQTNRDGNDRTMRTIGFSSEVNQDYRELFFKSFSTDR